MYKYIYTCTNIYIQVHVYIPGDTNGAARDAVN